MFTRQLGRLWWFWPHSHIRKRGLACFLAPFCEKGACEEALACRTVLALLYFFKCICMSRRVAGDLVPGACACVSLFLTATELMLRGALGAVGRLVVLCSLRLSQIILLFGSFRRDGWVGACVRAPVLWLRHTHTHTICYHFGVS